MNDFHAEFGLKPDIIYLNHAAVSPWPRRALEAIQGFAQENVERGAASYPRWLETENALREKAAKLLGAGSAKDISLLKSTSEGLSLVAQGLDWREGDNLVLYECEFPSNRYCWESLARYGVETRLVAHKPQDDPEGDLFAMCDARTRLISVSSVQFANGFRADLERIGAYCRAHGILFCVDGIQSLGALPFDVEACNADFVAADGHKWMLGPEGLALFYSRPELREQLRLHEYGWHMVEEPGDYDRKDWSPATDGTRFECGSPNLLGAYALNASLSLLLEVGMGQVSERVLANTRTLMGLFEASGCFEVLSDRRAERISGIVTVRPQQGDAKALHRGLMSEGVICAPRGGGIRFSPHFYTPEEQLHRAVEITLTLS